MDLMDSQAPLAPLDLVDVLEKVVLLCVTLTGLFPSLFCMPMRVITKILSTFSLRVLLVTLDLQALLALPALELTYLPSLVWVKLRNPLIPSGT